MSNALSYAARQEFISCPIAKQLLQLMEAKKTNLALSADVTTAKELLALLEAVGPEICVVKIHIDILTDFTPSLIGQLKQLAQLHQFLIFEDRKFADIGNTVKHQFADGIYQIAEWADIINAHALPGPGIVKGLQQANKQSGLLLLAEMSSAGNLFDASYKAKTLAMAEQFSDFVFGFITQRPISPDAKWLNFTPGVNFINEDDKLDQQYISPEQAIQHGSDIIIVGRGILKAADPRTTAKQYRHTAWRAYEERLANYS